MLRNLRASRGRTPHPFLKRSMHFAVHKQVRSKTSPYCRISNWGHGGVPLLRVYSRLYWTTPTGNRACPARQGAHYGAWRPKARSSTTWHNKTRTLFIMLCDEECRPISILKQTLSQLRWTSAIGMAVWTHSRSQGDCVTIPRGESAKAGRPPVEARNDQSRPYLGHKRRFDVVLISQYI
jgi:hypothetical protein